MTHRLEITISGEGDFPFEVLKEALGVIAYRDARSGRALAFHSAVIDGESMLHPSGKLKVPPRGNPEVPNGLE